MEKFFYLIWHNLFDILPGLKALGFLPSRSSDAGWRFTGCRTHPSCSPPGRGWGWAELASTSVFLSPNALRRLICLLLHFHHGRVLHHSWEIPILAPERSNFRIHSIDLSLYKVKYKVNWLFERGQCYSSRSIALRESKKSEVISDWISAFSNVLTFASTAILENFNS